MKIKLFFKEFIKRFLLTLIVALVVTYLWNLIMHNAGLIDWETSFRLAIIFGIVFGLTEIKDK